MRVLSHQPLFLYIFMAMAGTAPGRGDTVCSMSPRQKVGSTLIRRRDSGDMAEILSRYDPYTLPQSTATLEAILMMDQSQLPTWWAEI